MKIHIAQINPTVADFNGNLVLIVNQIHDAVANGADMVVFPELVITGYYPKDLLIEPGFIERADEVFSAICEVSASHPELHIVLGMPIRNPGPGKPLFNGLRVVKNGGWVLEYHKQLLPTYNVFDERRHFEAGQPNPRTIRVAGKNVAFLVCEDIWDVDGLDYLAKPLADLEVSRPDVIVSINASPSHVGKRAVRHALAKRIVQVSRSALVYVNQVGGQDELVFDGSSFVMSDRGTLVAECDRFVSQGLTVDLALVSEAKPDVRAERDLEPAAFYIEQIVLGLKDYMRRCGFKQVVVGSSGGIDSAVTLALAARAIGPENVVAITMPSEYSSVGSVDDSRVLCDVLGVKLFHHGIRGLVDVERAAFTAAFTEGMGFAADRKILGGLALENIQARFRGTILMTYSNATGALLLTTGNKAECAVGYATLYGDMNGGLNLIGDLYKMEVFAVAEEINRQAGRELIPQNIIDKAPSAELAPDQKDQDSLPPYPVLDEILRGLIEFEPKALKYIQSIERGSDEALKKHLVDTRRRLALSEYKRRQAAPIIRVRARAFGTGRQMPLTAKLWA